LGLGHFGDLQRAPAPNRQKVSMKILRGSKSKATPLSSRHKSVNNFLRNGRKIRQGTPEFLRWDLDHLQLSARLHANSCSHPCEHRNVANDMAIAEHHNLPLRSSAHEVNLHFTAQNNINA
jgi:hypothetical protein